MTFDSFTYSAIAVVIVAAVALHLTRRRRPTCKEMADFIDGHK